MSVNQTFNSAPTSIESFVIKPLSTEVDLEKTHKDVQIITTGSDDLNCLPFAIREAGIVAISTIASDKLIDYMNFIRMFANPGHIREIAEQDPYDMMDEYSLFKLISSATPVIYLVINVPLSIDGFDCGINSSVTPSASVYYPDSINSKLPVIPIIYYANHYYPLLVSSFALDNYDTNEATIRRIISLASISLFGYNDENCHLCGNECDFTIIG